MRANKILLLVSSLVTLLILGWAAVAENVLQEWRRLQRSYSTHASVAGSDFRRQLRQVVIPAIGVTDRCVSCHVGMAPGEKGILGDKVFSQHPDVAHDPGEFGCVVCHGGQGRATAVKDAHGDVPHWPKPMIPARFAYAGCGSCHTHLAVPNLRILEAGRTAFERSDCLSCHRLDGRGGTLRPGASKEFEGPDLSRLGSVGFDPEWYRKHLVRHEAGESDAWRWSFGALSLDDHASINVYLSSRVGAPGLVESKALFHSLGCRGCHKVGGVGGDDGPDLTQVGELDPGRLNYTHVEGPHTLENYLSEHFRAPGRVFPGSTMPEFGLSEQQIGLLTFYMLSLRRSSFPESYWPKDRILAERFGAREFSSDGATLYGTFCAACHGQKGQGMRYPGMASFPAIGNPDFLRLASDEFMRQTVRRGRPGRRMPAWGEMEGGLRPADVDSVIRFVRSLGGVAAPDPDPRPPRWARGDIDEGSRLFAASCTGCHGPRGEGAEGPALANQVLLGTATDTYLYETILRGRPGTSMTGFANPSTARRMLNGVEAEAVVAYIRTWEVNR